MATERISESLKNELDAQTHNPPGKSASLGAFYSAVLKDIDQKGPLSEILANVQTSRDITDTHMVNLLFRAVQYIKMYGETPPDLSYSTFKRPAQWEKSLSLLVGDSQKSELLEELLLKKHTTTTIYQRYVGPYALIKHEFGDQPVVVVDIGCGGNFGLRGFDLGIPFKPVVDHTPDKTVKILLQEPINLSHGYAIDKENPNTKEALEWRRACSFYPEELVEIDDYDQFEAKISKSDNVTFIQADMLKQTKPNVIPAKKADAVVLSTVLYQYNRDDQRNIINRVKRRYLSPQGVLIVQDFGEKNPYKPQQIDIKRSWFDEDFRYRTFISSAKTNWQFQEVVQWKNGRCAEVRAGADFARYFGMNYLTPDIRSGEITEFPETYVGAMLDQFGISSEQVENFDFRVSQIAKFIKMMITRGMPYHKALASLELRLLKHLKNYNPPFEIEEIDDPVLPEEAMKEEVGIADANLLTGLLRINQTNQETPLDRVYRFTYKPGEVKSFYNSIVSDLEQYYPGIADVELETCAVSKTEEGNCARVTLRTDKSSWTTAYIGPEESTATFHAMIEGLQYAVSHKQNQTIDTHPN